MARPRIIDPDGNTKTFGVTISQTQYEQLKAEAKERGISVSALVRAKLGL